MAIKTIPPPSMYIRAWGKSRVRSPVMGLGRLWLIMTGPDSPQESPLGSRRRKAHKGPVLLSGYNSEIHNNALKGWHRDETAALAQTSEHRREILWMNFEPVVQTSLFVQMEDS